jgi:hypothetical protein
MTENERKGKTSALRALIIEKKKEVEAIENKTSLSPDERANAAAEIIADGIVRGFAIILDK